MKKIIEDQEIIAAKELKKNRRRFWQKRNTFLIRVQKKWQEPLKEIARAKKKTLSKLHDEIYPSFVKENLKKLR